ncbi:MAG: NAD(P)/FAD-dependent oxidoreductase [Candidatus Micrarchaeota archaeon]
MEVKLKNSYDAIVIGGGPAGSVFAATAAAKGMGVLVLEKRKEIGAPVRCGEGLAEHWDAGKIPMKLPKGATNNSFPIGGAALFGPKFQRLEVRNTESKGWVLDRKVFDKALAMQAGRQGATILPKARVTSLVKEGGKIAGVKFVRMNEELEVRAPLVVSAEGMENLIARQAGFSAVAPLYDVDTCVQYEMVGVECEDLIEIYFGSAAPRGYVWVFPKGKDSANVGIGVGGLTDGMHGEKGQPDPQGYLDKFIREHPERFGKATAVSVQGGVISVGAPINEFVKDNFMVIGTAAHQVDPIHGGGIGLAMQAGYYGAKAAIAAHERKDYSKQSLYPYETEWRAAAQPTIDKRLKLRRVLEKMNDDDLNAVFDNLDNKDLEKLLAGDFRPVVTKVLAKRPQLLKVVSALA